MGKYRGYVRKGPYKEDSTKGQSLMRPKTYKGDVMVQVWMDSRVLATLSLWLDNEGDYTRFMSEVVRTPLTILCDHLVDSGSVDMVEDTIEARDMLERKYKVNLNPDGKGLKNFNHNNILRDKIKGIGIKTSGPATSIPTQQIDKSVVEEATRIYEEISKPKERMKVIEECDTSPIVEQVSTEGLNEEKYKLLMGEPSVDSKGKVGSRPKLKSKEEADKAMLEVDKEDRAELERLKNM